jgi:hypothetical protein
VDVDTAEQRTAEWRSLEWAREKERQAARQRWQLLSEVESSLRERRPEAVKAALRAAAAGRVEVPGAWLAHALLLAAQESTGAFAELLHELSTGRKPAEDLESSTGAAEEATRSANGPGTTQQPRALRLDLACYAELLAGLVADCGACRPIAVRLCLNLALPVGAEPVQPLPSGVTDLEAALAEEGTQEDGEMLEEVMVRAETSQVLGASQPLVGAGAQGNGAANGRGDGDGTREGAGIGEADVSVSDRQVDDVLVAVEHGAQQLLEFCGCTVRPSLNGIYERADEFASSSVSSRPVYRIQRPTVLAGDESADEAAEEQPQLKGSQWLCFFWQFGDSPKDAGWWFGAALGSKEGIVGFCPSDAPLPPAKGAGWQLLPERKGKRRTRDAQAGFKRATERRRPDEVLADADAETPRPSAEEAVRRLDVNELLGCVFGTDERASRYFGHFGCALHLEFLEEILDVRRRLRSRTADSLKRVGLMVAPVRAIKVVRFPARHGGRHKLKVTFALPRKTVASELRLKKGECVLVSSSNPLVDSVGEGTLLQLADDKAVVGLEAPAAWEVDDTRWQSGSWRLDAGPNRTSYSRQLAALVGLCTTRSLRPLQALLLAGDVSKAAEWAQREREGLDLHGQLEASANREARAAWARVQGAHVHAGTRAAGMAPTTGSPGAAIHAMAAVEASGEASEASGAAKLEVSAASEEVPMATDPSDRAPPLAIPTSPSLPPPLVQQLAMEPLRDGLDLEVLAKLQEEVVTAPRLSDSQRRAILAAFERRLTIIQGPPGTGKTSTSVQILRGWAALQLRPALCVAECNVAVDNIAMGLHAVGTKVVRVGRADKVSERLDAFALDTLVVRRHCDRELAGLTQRVHAAEQRLVQVRRELEALEASVRLRMSNLVVLSDEELRRRLAETEEAQHAAAADDSALASGERGRDGAESADAAARELPTAMEMQMCGCSVQELNGLYRARTLAQAEEPTSPNLTSANLTSPDPAHVPSVTLEQVLPEGPAGATRAPAVCFYYAGGAELPSGWYLSRRTPLLAGQPIGKKKRKHLVGFCPSVPTPLPPSQGWSVVRNGIQQADPTAGFQPPPPRPPPGRAELIEALRAREFAALGGAAAIAAIEDAKAAADSARADVVARGDLNRHQVAGASAILMGLDAQALQELQHEVLADADVICAQTLSAGGHFLARLGPLRGLLIDEVAQATEPACLVPILARGCERLVLVGDHCQLPPSVRSHEAEARGLSLSLFGRLIAEGVRPHFLDTQYRAHPRLMRFASEVIYSGQLRSGLPPSARPPVRGFAWPSAVVPIAFIEVDAHEQIEHDSKLNRLEAERLMALLEMVLVAGDVSTAEVGVVTPYTAQVRLLRSLWRERCTSRRVSRDEARALEIASVDAFQGREKDLILFSAVRANPAGRVGFLGDWRRLNVLLTRARRGLIVLGHASTLRHDPLWMHWLEAAADERVIIDRRRWLAVLGRAIQSIDWDDVVPLHPQGAPRLRNLLRELQGLEYASLRPVSAFCEHLARSGLSIGNTLRMEDAGAMVAVLEAAANGWCGSRAEILSLLRAAPEGRMPLAVLGKAVLRRWKITHRAADDEGEGDAYCEVDAAPEVTEDGEKACTPAVHAAFGARERHATVKHHLSRVACKLGDGQVAIAAPFARQPAHVPRGCEWGDLPGAPPLTDEPSEQLNLTVWRSLCSGGRSSRGGGGTVVLGATPGPMPSWAAAQAVTSSEAAKRAANSEGQE